MMKLLIIWTLAVFMLALMAFCALLMHIHRIERMVEDMPWEIVSLSEENTGEDRREKPPDRTETKAPAEGGYRTPMARISADRLARRRNEVDC